MENLKVQSLRDYAKAQGIKELRPMIQKSENGSLYVVCFTDKKSADGKTVAECLWFSKNSADKGIVAEGELFTKELRDIAVVSQYINDEGEPRTKVGFGDASLATEAF